MKRMIIAGAALSAVVLTAAFAQADTVNKKLKLTDVVGCQVSGTPSEFPDDIVIKNKGINTLAAGTKITWSVKGAGAGSYTLPSALAAGNAMSVSGVLGAGVEAGKACNAKVI